MGLVTGTLARESAFAIASLVANQSGREFAREGVVPRGGHYRTVWRTDGTCLTHQVRPQGSTWEWTDAAGNYHASLVEPRALARSAMSPRT